MALHETELRQRYTTLIVAFRTAFPNVQPPDPEWWALWMDKYPADAILRMIRVLSLHPLKSRFNQISTGKALSALLRQDALKRAVGGVK